MIGRLSCRRHIWILTIIFILLCSSLSYGQGQSQYDKGTPPQHAAGVSPLGSYTSTDLGSVNLSNGALNFKIPLATVGGRGFSIPLTLNYSSKVWSASMDTAQDNNSNPFQAAYADYANIEGFVDFYQRLGPGWTIGATPMIFNRIVRIGQLPPQGPFDEGCYTYTVPKLTVMLPDKGEIEFRDDLYNGAPLPSDCGGWVSASRGKRWHATDGSGTIYISDLDNGAAERDPDFSGVVITADGTRYRFNGPSCTSITDRNGNRIDITYSTSPSKVEYKDQLGRITKIEQFVPDPHNPSVTLAGLVTIPGYGGNRYIKLKRAVMSSNYRSDNTPPGQVCNGNYDPLSKGYSTWCGSNPTILFPHSYGLFLQRIDNQQVLSEVVLPDQRSLRFRYNVFGEVAEAELLTGGKIWYDYEESTVPAGNSPLWEIGGGFHTEVGEVDRAIVKRRVFDGGTHLATWDYSYSASDVYVNAKSPTQEVLLYQRHHFLPSGRYDEYVPSLKPHDGTHYSLWSTGVEWRTETLNAAGTVVLSAVEKDWTQRTVVTWTTGYPQEQPTNDNRVNQERSYLENGMMAKTETSYDQYNNPIEVKEYDFDQTLKRRTEITYLSNHNGFNYQTDDAIHLLRLPNTQTTYEGANQKAKTVIEYDVYDDDQNHAPLLAYNPVSQHDSSYGPLKKTRGNPTRRGIWLNTTDSYIYTYPRYDILGNVVALKDPRGHVSTLNFADDFGDGSNPGTSTQNPTIPTYALPTVITSPPPLQGAPVHTTRSQYDYSTGLRTGFRDPNDVVTQTIYDDPFNRPTRVKAALNIQGLETHVSNYYAPATALGITLARNDVLTVSDLNDTDDASIRSWTVTDGFGRTREAWKQDPQGDVKVITTYDALGRTEATSNPFRPSNETAVYTITAYDMLGRVTSVKTPDLAVATTSYVANSATVTDQAGNSRKSVTDALGRLKQVIEDLSVPNGLNFETTYAYDALDNLTGVTQGAQTRTFVYDSLKRLRSAINPESGTINYDYDNNGNLITKTDARGITITYGYDALNRNTSVNYSNTTIGSPDVPDITRVYDGAEYGKGRLWSSYAGGNETVGNNVEKTLISKYDATGQPLELRQFFKSNGTWEPNQQPYQVTRTYNLAGGVTSQVYPSGRSVTYNYDSAGRLADDGQNLAFTGNLGGVARTYSTGISYASAGQIKQEQFGTNTPIYNKRFYNSRQQLAEILTSTVGGDNSWNRGKILNQYSLQCSGAGCNATDNNGNLRKQEVYIPADDQVSSFTSWYQQYDYDKLNRLKRVHEYTGNSQTDWQQEFDYDRWGNRTLSSTGTWVGNSSNPPDPLLNETQFDTGDLSLTNRLYAPGDLALPENQRRMRYDAAGNLTKDTYTAAGDRVYDAENRMTQAWGGDNQWQYYTYNADGQRTRRKINNQETWQIYGFEGELLAEYAASGAVGQPKKEYGYRNGQLLVTAEGGTSARINVASAANGGTATASSTLVNPPYSYSVSALINGDHKGLNAGMGGNWHSATATFPQSVEVVFNGSKTINEIDVFTLQDNYANPIEPTEATTFSLYGVTGFEVQYWNGSWVTVPGGSVTGSNKVWKKITFAPLTTTKIRVVTNASTDGFSRLVEIEAWSPAVPETSTNVASAANGGTVTASSTLVNPPYSYPASALINGDHKGLNAGMGGNWHSATATFPQSLEITFNGSKTINEVDVFTLQDNYANPVEPTEATTFSLYGVTGFEVQYWNGSWVTVPGGSVTGSNKVWKKITFASVTTTKIRVQTNASTDGFSRLVEIEAWSPAVPETSSNVASAANGATATASSTLVNPPYSYPVSALINGDHKGLNAGMGGNWHSATATFPQSVEVVFNGSKTINEIDVFTLQDNYANPIEPTEATTFSLYGVTGFEVQYWNGSWVTVPGGSVTGSNKVWKKITFAPLTTTKIRVVTNASTDGFSRLVEIEAWSSSTSDANINWLVSDHLGTPRMIIDQTGTLANVKRHDYLPFGEELFAGVGGRTSQKGYGSGDDVRQQFTAKERDVETGLDYSIARYYSSTQGRFTSFDPEGAGAREGDPQSWNGYAYAGGNPVLFSDPDGREYLVCDPNGKNCTIVSDQQFQDERKTLQETGNVYTGSGNFYESGQIKNDEGGVVATYVQFSIDDLQHRQLAAIAAGVDPIPMATLQFFGLSAVLGTGVGVIAYVAPSAAATTLGLGGAAASKSIPSHVRRVLSHLKNSKGNPPQPPPGYKGARKWKNDGRGAGQTLPKTDANGNPIKYHEYDVNPYQQGVNRGTERIVRGTDGSTYYTTDHYKTFTRIE